MARDTAVLDREVQRVMSTAWMASQTHEELLLSLEQGVEGILDALASDSTREVALALVRKRIESIRTLPDAEVIAFFQELRDAAVESRKTDRPEPLQRVLTEWKSTAAVYADPNVLAALLAPTDYDEPVRRPAV